MNDNGFRIPGDPHRNASGQKRAKPDQQGADLESLSSHICDGHEDLSWYQCVRILGTESEESKHCATANVNQCACEIKNAEPNGGEL